MGYRQPIAALAATAMLAGCASPPMTRTQLAAYQAALEQSTLKIDCPAGCSVAYRDPRTKVEVPMPTNGWDAAISMTRDITGMVSTAVVPAAAAYVAVEGFRRLEGSGQTTTTTTNTTTTDNSVGDNSGDYSGSGGDQYVDNAGPIQSDLSTDNSQSGNIGDQSGVTGKVISDNSGTVDSPVDSTGTPTIVEQPAPVIVPQPTE